MVAPNNPNVAKIAMVFGRDTRTFVNVFHVFKTGGWDMTSLTTVSNLFRDWWINTYRPNSSSAVSLRRIEARVYNPALPLALDTDVSPPSPGIIGTAPDTGATTLTMSWRSNLAGRKHRGRNYVVGLAEGEVNTDDTLASPRVTGIASAAGTLLSQLIAAGLQMVIFHRVDNTVTNVLTVIIENLIDSQRRRLANRGA